MKNRSTKQIIVFSSLCSILCCYVFFGKQGLSKYLYLKQEINAEQEQVSDIEGTIERLKSKIQAWKKEDFEREKMVRQDLNMGFTNELVYKVPAGKQS